MRYTIPEIDAKLKSLEEQVSDLKEMRHCLVMLDAMSRYTCSCVNINEKMGIHDMAEQERRNRRGLQIGIVSETLSASRSCPDCGGSGVPK